MIDYLSFERAFEEDERKVWSHGVIMYHSIKAWPKHLFLHS